MSVMQEIDTRAAPMFASSWPFAWQQAVAERQHGGTHTARTLRDELPGHALILCI